VRIDSTKTKNVDLDIILAEGPKQKRPLVDPGNYPWAALVDLPQLPENQSMSH
jgi:hypothetical protein